MRAVVLTEPEELRLVDLPEPDCGPHEVLVRMRGLGLCGSDLAVYTGSRPVDAPWLMGHEGVGEIVAVGGAVEDRQVGQQVAIEPNYCCGRCPACCAGFTSACPNRVIVGMNHPGLLAEYVAVPAAFTWPAAATVAIEDLVCTEALTVARSAIRRSGVGPGDRCLVVGAGSQGLLLCLALQELGATAFVQEPHEGRVELARSFGAAPVAGDDGFDFLFETSGVPQALHDGLGRVAPGGTALLVGISTRPLELTSADLVYRQITLRGSLIYDHPADFDDTVAVLDRGAITPGKVLQARFDLTEAAEAFASVRSVAGKSWISF
ncbi:alcohol dehydrogenase catalytic domain-containing protein [Amycolatopsis acidiphila]|uniref:Zinc-binding dehydrogenase n=1 Tax=Amycolatopsis acidiphila TaxID=715473 RepID=A0A557ZML8_9PSEU|nr:alcohol dehydrogenase catalytic domain-containing protein [Amycolatopsis acidiphila]TVT13233.1 zinc-binding dehydrogenase [Amycolatopsis acidiphila]UIJ59343.1 alcohol dehydrogenase catalytic domain-containing protein [Amycolatopsis acidiphila]GHG79818.1 dehydrogenase [Amycolatopsis acidiphila]